MLPTGLFGGVLDRTWFREGKRKGSTLCATGWRFEPAKETTPMTGPTFVCEFVDGVVTRMTTHCPDGLDPARGIRLSRAAYESRRRRPPPEILKGHFEDDDRVVKTYDAAAIAAID